MDGPLPGAVNMARDHALALGLPPDQAALRLYRWAVPTLSLGRNEPARDRVDRDALRGRGIDLVRRPTGGRAVLHHRELTYAVALPLRSGGGMREGYLAVNRALRRGLASLGVRAEIAGERSGAPAPPPDAGPCFREPAPGELVAAGRKLVGSAQARIGRVMLQHGSILVADDQGAVSDLLGGDAPGDPVSGEGPGAPATLEELLDGSVPGWGVLESAVRDGFRQEMGGRWPAEAEVRVDPDEQDRLEERYRSPAWTWRR